MEVAVFHIPIQPPRGQDAFQFYSVGFVDSFKKVCDCNIREIRRSLLVSAKCLAGLEYHTKHKFDTWIIGLVGVGQHPGLL